MAKKNYYYAVASGRVPGVYRTWKDVIAQTKRYPNAIFKKFTIRSDAEDFVRKRQPATVSLSMKEVEASQQPSTKRVSRFPPPVITSTKRKGDHDDGDKKAAKKSKDTVMSSSSADDA
ncbi:hypothetical protein MBANPS3_000250 [Mucor bainieri]